MSRVSRSCLVLLIGFACLLPQVASASVSSLTGPHDWMDGYTLVLLSTDDVRTFVSVRNAIQASGARVAVAMPNRVILGWVPPELFSKISALPGVKGVFTEPVPETLLEGAGAVTLSGVRFFNSVVSGELKAEMEKAEQAEQLEKVPEFHPLIDDMFEAPPTDMDAYLRNLRSIGFNTDKEVMRLSGLDPSLATLGNSDDMIGTVTVTLFFVESDGSMDPNTYTWSTSALNATVTSATTGLSWWSSQASGYGKTVSFTVYYYPGTDVRCQTGYEPIIHPSTDARYWIEEIMASFGYSSGSHIDRVNAYNTWVRSNYGTNWAYSAFIEYNPPPAGTAFTNGYSAWAYRGGPYTNLLYRSFSWAFDLVFSHETGHIFTACDEYYVAGYGGCTSCGLCSHGINNSNCEYCNSQAVLCMMRNNDKVLCAFTPGQLGWLDGPIVKYYSHVINDPTGNNNGIADPGESVTMPLTLKNWGLPVTGVSATLSTADPYITISSNYSTYTDMSLNGTATSSTPYAFSSSPGTPVTHVATFTLAIVGTGYDATSTFTVRIGEAPILLVDDDGGAAYETYYKDALSANGYTYTNWVVKTQGSPSLSELNKRKVVIWLTSFQSTVTLTGQDETNLQSFLNAGGTLFFSSQDYLSERFASFAQNYLHVQAFNMDVVSTSETGVSGDPISNGLNLAMSYPFDNYSDDITPGSNAGAILINSTSNPGALRYPTLGTAPHKVVFFAFPFEAIANGTTPNNRATAMKRVVDWLLAPQDYQPPSVAVGAPNGGEEWEVASEHEITWVATDNKAVDSVSIYYSTDGGATFPYTIATSEANDSSFTWVVPDTPSESCVVKVVAYDSSLNEAEDVSNALFAIVPPPDLTPPEVTVVRPNGGEAFYAASEDTIRWVATDNIGVDSVSIYYSTDCGRTFPYTVATGEANDSVYVWTVPDTPSDSCIVKVIAYDTSLNPGEDVSDAVFGITNPIGSEPAPEVTRFGLMQNHPNPFNPVTRIEYSLDEGARVSLRIYDISGSVVKTLVQETMPAGRHTAAWNGQDESGTAVASGIYVCRLEAKGKTAMRKMVLLK